MRLTLCCLLFAAASPTFAAPGALTITLADVRSSDGEVVISVEGSAAGWNGEAESIAVAKLDASRGALTHTFEKLPPGEYAVQVLHDANRNGKLDSNFLGIPSEGYGFSRNPRVMRRAHFSEARFDLPAAGAKITIQMR